MTACVCPACIAVALRQLIAEVPPGGGGGKGAGSWDQFKVNQNRFGVKTTFDESIYTTKLDPSRSRYTKEEADRLAAEIEGQVSSSNAHLAEERGMELDDEVGRL